MHLEKVFLLFIFQAQGLLGSASIDKTAGTLLYNMVTRLKDSSRLSFLTEYIIRQKVTSELQLAGIWLSLLFCYSVFFPPMSIMFCVSYVKISKTSFIFFN